MNGNLDVLRGLASAVWRSSRFLSRTKILLLASSVMFMSMGIAQVIHIEGRNMSLRQILDELKKQSGYSVFIRKDVLDNASTINLQKKNRTVEELLEEVTRGQQLDYQIKGKEIVLSKKAIAPQAVQKTSRSTVESDAQQETVVRGVLVDTEGKPVAKATVSSKSTGTKVETDASGRFQIKVSLPDELLVSYIGFAPKKVAVADTRALRITLQSTAVAVEDVVVTGLFSRPTENFTGSAVTLKGEELRKVGVTDIFKNVAALDPAFNITSNNALGGSINQLPDIQIRGQNSFPTLKDDIATNPNQPLFILDGFEVNIQRIKDLDINIIASVVVLKDASATTIYGSRGANGVMVINTIPPVPGKLRATVVNDFSVTTPDLSVYRLLDGRQKLDFEQRVGIYKNDDPNQQYALDQLYNERLKAVEGGINTDWRNLAVQTGLINRTSVALTGGDHAVRYGITAGANLQNGVMKGQDRTNYNGQFDFTYLHGKFRFSNSARFYQTKSNESPYGSFSTYLKMNPYWSPYDSDNSIRQYLEDYTADGPYIFNNRVTNPLRDGTLNIINSEKLTGLQNNFSVRYDVVPSLFIESKFGITKELVASDYFLPGSHSSFDKVQDPALRGSYTKGQSERLNYEFSTSFNYKKAIKRHLILGTGVVELGSNATDGYKFNTTGFLTDNLDHMLYATQYEPNSRPVGTEGKVNRVGFLVNGNYSYDGRYLADVSLRKDGSSSYGTDRKFGDFWSVGLGWNIHNEEFFKNNENINRLKLRSTYGVTGSLAIPAYTSLTQYKFDKEISYDGELGVVHANIGNANLGWQEKREFNIGTDVELFNSRLTLRAEYYNSTTNQAITELSLAPSVGFASYYENYGKINNKGIEVAVQYQVLSRPSQNIAWTLFANGLHNTNKLLAISDQLKTLNTKLNTKSNYVPNFLFEEGRSTTTLYAVQSLGIDPATGQEVYLKKNGTKTYTWSAADKIAYGNTLPKMQGSFGTNLFYKGFELNVILDYKFGGQLYNQTLVDRVENINPYENVDSRAYELGWKYPGDISLYRQIHIQNNKQTFTTTRFVEDENTLNINSISFGYFMNNSPFIKRMGIGSLRVRATSNDISRFSSVRIERGTDNPFARTYSLSLNVTF